MIPYFSLEAFLAYQRYANELVRRGYYYFRNPWLRRLTRLSKN